MLVTGSEGFIGTVLSARLAAEGHRVTAGFLDEAARMPAPPGVTYERLDVTDASRVRDVVRACAPAQIYHLAAMSLPSRSWVEPGETLRVNVQGTVNVLEEARRCSPQPQVFIACSSAEYGDAPIPPTGTDESSPLLPLHPYGVSKVTQDLLGRQYFRNYGLPVVRGRIFNTIGPRKTHDAPSDFASQIAQVEAGKARSVRVGNLDTRRDFTDVQDMVVGIKTITTKGRAGDVYNLCSGRPTSLRVAFESLLSFARRKVPWEVDPERLRPADEPLILGDNRKVATELGWSPQIPVVETMRSIYDYWRTVEGVASPVDD
ncbi:MAG TPA: GDP-mannose 4,6-dehydratase [Thermoplasmata archaeon]|nr:GDP-mannose 4,6-dehydratase [Thermoplasmata archaeon]